MKKYLFIGFILFFVFGCNQKPTQDEISKWKTEVEKAEKQFMEMAANEGLAKAFTYFAADSAVVRRGESIIKGKQAINDAYSKPSKSTNINLIWKPDFIDVSNCGTMAYTYGKYTYSYTDTLGVNQSSEGLFHTVWRRQANGEWRYVFD